METSKIEIKKLERLNTPYINTNGELFKIIEYFSSKNCTVQFDDGTICYNVSYGTVLTGEIKNYNTPSLFGVGYIGTQHRFKNKSNIFKKASVKWESMINRCYNKKFQEKHPTYKNCTVDERWHNFQVFAKWYEENWKPWMNSEWHLDKDILSKDCKIYSPETCAFVPREINNLLKERRRNLPMGITYDRNSIRATISKYNKQELVGYYNNIEDASKAFNLAKKQYIVELAEKWKHYIVYDIYKNLVNYEI